MDLKYRYDKVKRAIQEVMLPTFYERFREVIRRTRHSELKRLLFPAGRFVYPIISRQAFEELQWSWLKRIVETAIAEGITPAFHFDADWSESFNYLKELPKGKCFVHWGGETDIFKAKEALRGHMCIMGDVSAAMISVSPPQEVEAYCRKLIDEVGKDNGFIMCEGCFLPATAKFENVKVMVDVAKNYMPR
jgi:uroporphyrinogen decarboxylase